MSKPSTIQLRHGTQTDISKYSSVEGELLFGTDSKILSVGSYPVTYWRNETNQFNIYVSPIGSVGNSGLSAASPLPLVDAIAFAKTQQSSYCWNGIQLILETGSYYITSSLIIDGVSSIRLNGTNYANPRNHKIYTSGSANGFPIFSITNRSTFVLTGVQLIPGTIVSGSLNQHIGVAIDRKSWIYIDNVVFGDTGTWMRYNAIGSNQSTIILANTASIDGGVVYNNFDVYNGSVFMSSIGQYRFANNPVSTMFMRVANCSSAVFFNVPTIVGSNQIGRKGSIEQFSRVSLSGTPLSNVPGTLPFASGSSLTGAV